MINIVAWVESSSNIVEAEMLHSLIFGGRV
jgi:hypothetical protein